METEKGISAKPCIAHWEYGPEKDILKAIAERGFAFVGEASCEALLSDLGHDAPAPDGDSPNRKIELALKCMQVIEPEWTDVQALQALNRAVLLENPDTYADLRAHTKHVEEVVTNVEKKKVHDYHAALSQTRTDAVSDPNTHSDNTYRYNDISTPPAWPSPASAHVDPPEPAVRLSSAYRHEGG